MLACLNNNQFIIMELFEVDFNEEGKIVDFLSGALLETKPEELVRQKFLKVLHFEYQYPKNVLAREVTIHYGSKELKDKEGNPVRADIVIYSSPIACANKNQGQNDMV
jgi:hypothetical protein